METAQFLTLMITFIGGIIASYKFTRDEMKLMNENHRADMLHMDSKWERLFEKLLVKETK